MFKAHTLIQGHRAPCWEARLAHLSLYRSMDCKSAILVIFTVEHRMKDVHSYLSRK